MEKKETISKYLKKIAALTCVLILGAVSLTACGSSNDSKSSDLSGEVVIAGSTSVQPLSEELAKEFMKEHGDVKVTVQGGGSGQGIKSIEEKIADIGSLSRDVKDEEKKSVNKEYTIAKDGVAVVVCTDVDIDDISLRQLKDIYTGKITNWKDLGGKDKKISVISREEGSGTRGAFTELTGVLVKDDKGNETDNTTSKAIVQPSTGAVIKTISNTSGSIGYVSLAAVENTVKALKVEGVEADTDTVLDGSYKITRPFVYVTGGDVSSSAQSFIDYVMSDEGQKLIQKNGFIPVK